MRIAFSVFLHLQKPKSVSKVLLPGLKNFIIARIFEVEACFKLFWNVNQKDDINIHKNLKFVEILVVTRELKK